MRDSKILEEILQHIKNIPQNKGKEIMPLNEYLKDRSRRPNMQIIEVPKEKDQLERKI